MAGPREVRRLRIRVHRSQNRGRTILRRDAGRDAFGRLDADGKRRAKPRTVLSNHHRQLQLIADLAVEGEADQPTSFAGHLGNQFGRSELGCKAKVPLVFTIGVVNQHDGTAGLQFF